MAERHGAILGRLADLGMSLAEDLHARALAAPDEASANDLALAFHRISRCVRQTLALEARLHREARRAERDAVQDLHTRQIHLRVEARRTEVRKAVTRLIWTEHEPDETRALLEDLDNLVSKAARNDAFLDTPVEAVIERIHRDLIAAAPTPPKEPIKVVIWKSTDPSPPAGEGGLRRRPDVGSHRPLSEEFNSTRQSG